MGTTVVEGLDLLVDGVEVNVEGWGVEVVGVVWISLVVVVGETAVVVVSITGK